MRRAQKASKVNGELLNKVSSLERVSLFCESKREVLLDCEQVTRPDSQLTLRFHVARRK